MLEVLEYCKNRIVKYHISIKYYEDLEASRGILTRDEELAYNNYITAVNELGRVVDFIDMKLNTQTENIGEEKI